MQARSVSQYTQSGEEKQVENLILFRDTAFWWLGVWTLCTGIDIAVWRCMRRRHLERRGGPQFYDQDAESDGPKPEETGTKEGN